MSNFNKIRDYKIILNNLIIMAIINIRRDLYRYKYYIDIYNY